MNLKMTLAAAAVAAVAAAPVVSHADATLYGKVQLGLSQAGKTSNTTKATTSFFDNGTRFGIKGSDALGNDMTSFYKMEFSTPGIGSSSTSSWGNDPGPGMKTRYAYIGAKGNFGTVVGGRIEDLFYAMVEAPTDTPNAIGGSMGPTGSGYVSRVNAIAYMTPNMGGFTGGVAVGNIGTDITPYKLNRNTVRTELRQAAAGLSAGRQVHLRPGLRQRCLHLHSEGQHAAGCSGHRLIRALPVLRPVIPSACSASTATSPRPRLPAT